MSKIEKNNITCCLLNLKEAGIYLGVSKFTIKRWIFSDKLKAIKLPGGHWRVPKTSCDDLIKEGLKDK